ncbi:uncharacterized protein C9orf85 [Parasteatoda tepidariorum]|uniref:Uncharacterized protein C9orf85 homolog n=1 Tax=Parasteatoda tepidariorum TaxID=114398 RepID=A0A2L2YAV1_PARTP|nr:uncharacterized protein C9orf85 [Parasteatoda tepidariorum]
MSTQKGNTARTRPQKYKNSEKFNNARYDKTKKTQMINNLELIALCPRCEAIISWKIKYKKYKPLTVPGKCIKCEKKNVKRAYNTICLECSEELDVCAKCGETVEHSEDSD